MVIEILKINNVKITNQNINKKLRKISKTVNIFFQLTKTIYKNLKDFSNFRKISMLLLCMTR